MAVCVVTVSVAVAACVPEIAAGWLTEHVGGAAAPDAPLLTAHASATLPVNPPPGATVIVEVVEPPGAMGPAAPAVTENEGVAGMVYAALVTLLEPMVGLIAIALIVSVVVTETGAE